MSDRAIIKLPFPGFYESLYSGELDHVEEQEADWMAERDAQEQPEELRLSAEEFAEILFNVTDNSAAYRDIAREYVASFDQHFSDVFGFPLGLEYESMDSPREYNFRTDRVYAYVAPEVVRWLFDRSRFDNYETLTAVIRERFTSRDGFLSGYKNDLDSWLAKPLADWDHNELETLLLANMRLALSAGDDDDDWRWPIYYGMAENNDFHNAFSNAVDWDKFEAQVAELRADKLAERQEQDPDYVPPYRCPSTPDMFGDWLGGRA